LFVSSNSEFTTIKYSLDQNNTADSVNPMLGQIPANGLIDFQVEAFILLTGTDYAICLQMIGPVGATYKLFPYLRLHHLPLLN
jgi:hypothetical protein